jgi:hypothetical protein
MHGSRFRFQVPVPVSLYRCIAVSLFSSSPLYYVQLAVLHIILFILVIEICIIYFSNDCFGTFTSRGLLDNRIFF